MSNLINLRDPNFFTETFNKISPCFHADKRFNIIWGGSSSSKSYSAYQQFILSFLTEKERDYLVMRKHGTTIYDSVFQGMRNIINEFDISEYFQFYESPGKLAILNKNTGHRIIFRGLDDTEKMKSIVNIKYCLLEEATEFTLADWLELNRRLRGFTGIKYFLVYNPVSRTHWINKHFFQTEKVTAKTFFVHCTYHNNRFNTEEDIEQLENLKDIDENDYRVYCLGEWGVLSSRIIFKNWQIIDSIPEDAKRIPSGMDFGFSCFEGSTLITTSKGDIPIKDIKVGDFVLTRNGYRKVLKHFNNGHKNVVEKYIGLDFGYTKISCTLEHNFNINGKWKQFKGLVEKDILCILSSSMGKYIQDTQTEKISTISETRARLMAYIFKRNYIMPYMNFIMGQYQKVKSYTTLTRIVLITTLIIWLLSLRLNTVLFIEIILRTLIKQKEDLIIENYIHTTKQIGVKGVKRFFIPLVMKLEYAIDVKQNIHQLTHIKDSVQRNVITNGNIQMRVLMLKCIAKSAIKSLWVTNILNQKHVVKPAPISYQEVTNLKTLNSNRIVEVYDIEVEQEHEYFANGILVHNCDPTTLVDVYMKPGELYIDERIYETGLLNVHSENGLAESIQSRLEQLNFSKTHTIIADSAENKSIAEIRGAGYNIYAVKKPGIGESLKILKSYRIFITKSSKNTINEFENFMLKIDRNGVILPEPIEGNDHIIDPIRYVIWMKGRLW